VSIHGVEDGPKNGNYAPSFHIIVNHVNEMTKAQLRGPNFPPKDERGTILGPTGE